MCSQNQWHCPWSWTVLKTNLVSLGWPWELCTFINVQSGLVVWNLQSGHQQSKQKNTVQVKKSPPRVFFTFFPKQLGISSPNFTHLLNFSIYTQQFFYLILCNLMKLCHIKCDHPACFSTDGGHFEHIMVVALNMATSSTLLVTQ